MEAVPSLCASGTLGIAAVGFAFGHPHLQLQHQRERQQITPNGSAQIPTAKRRAISATDAVPSTDIADAGHASARPLSGLPWSGSGRIQSAKLRKRSSTGWRTLPAVTQYDVGKQADRWVATEAGAQTGLDEHNESWSSPTPLTAQVIKARKSSTFDPKLSENGISMQERPGSTMSSHQTSSSAQPNSPRPGSSAISQSNGSTAPILPLANQPNFQTPTRNKLVKRSSSHRLLTDHGGLYSQLRRPATSHQRSASLKSRAAQTENLPADFQSSPLTFGLPEHHESVDSHMEDDAMRQRWRPFFRQQQNTPLAKQNREGLSSKKRTSYGVMLHKDTPPIVVPDSSLAEFPTLILATEVDLRSSDEFQAGHSSEPSVSSRPFTPSGLQRSMPPPNTDSNSPPVEAEREARPRNSLSLSLHDIFPSPSPLTWKVPRPGTFGRPRNGGRGTGGRRVVSAPQSTQPRRKSSLALGEKSLGNHTQIYASPYETTPLPTSSHQPWAADPTRQRTPSSPLPPLASLSAFEINLPASTPSYPTTPRPELTPNFDPLRMHSPSSSSSSHRPFSGRGQHQRPSGSHSDHASTLLGSDIETSRVFATDEDDVDGRSDTLYDSARTGATSSSLSRSRRPHIDTIFDESPPTAFAPTSHPMDMDGVDETTLTHRDLSTIVNNESESHDLNIMDVDDISVPLHELGLDDTPQKGTDINAVNTMTAELATLPFNGKSDIMHAEMSREEYNESDEFDNRTSDIMSRSRKTTPKRRTSPPLNPFEWSEAPAAEKDSPKGESNRPKTSYARHLKESRGSRLSGRRLAPALHLRSQSVPVPHENRNHSGNSKLESWVLGGKGPSEDWDGDFDFDDPPMPTQLVNDSMQPSLSSGMLVPSAIMERQASVHGQFGQVKELTKLVEELKRLQQQARLQGLMVGQAAELWKEAEGIITLATLDDDEQDFFPPRSPTADFDFEDDDTTSSLRRPSINTLRGDDESGVSNRMSIDSAPRPSYERASQDGTPAGNRPRAESTAKAKAVLENLQQPSGAFDAMYPDSGMRPEKLRFDTTSLSKLVVRAGVVTRALKEEVRKAESRTDIPATIASENKPSTPPDPPFSQMFHKPSPTPSFTTKTSRITSSPKSPKSPRSNMIGGSIAGNDNELNGHMSIMTVV